MPNPMTVDRVVGGATGGAQQGTKFAPAITLVTTTEKIVLDQTGGVATVYAMPQSGPSASGSYDVFKFIVRATFKCTTGGSATNIVTLYLGNPSTIVTGNALATITSQSLATLTGSGFLEFHGIWDSTSLIISGIQFGGYGTTAVSGTIVTNTGLTAANLAALKFSISSKNGSSVTGTTFQLGEFTSETA